MKNKLLSSFYWYDW